MSLSKTNQPHNEEIIWNSKLVDKYTDKDIEKIQEYLKQNTILEYEKWRERLAKQEMLTPPGHLVSTLVSRRPLMTTGYAIICATMKVRQLFRILLLAVKSCQDRLNLTKHADDTSSESYNLKYSAWFAKRVA